MYMYVQQEVCAMMMVGRRNCRCSADVLRQLSLPTEDTPFSTNEKRKHHMTCCAEIAAAALSVARYCTGSSRLTSYLVANLTQLHALHAPHIRRIFPRFAGLFQQLHQQAAAPLVPIPIPPTAVAAAAARRAAVPRAASFGIRPGRAASPEGGGSNVGERSSSLPRRQ